MTKTPSAGHFRLPLFFLSSLILALAPGPDNCFVLAQSAAAGAWAGLAVTGGLVSGVCVHVLLAALGLATLVKRFPAAADTISLFGALYLFWVAWGMLGSASGLTGQAEALSLPRLFLRGVILNISNPKVILFFVAFLPRFLPEPCPHRFRSLLVLGGLFVLAAASVMAAVALLGGLLADWLKDVPGAAVWVNRAAAAAVAAIGLWILVPLAKSRLKRKQA